MRKINSIDYFILAKITNILAVADIISRPQFQRYLKNVVTPLIGSEPFQWTKCIPPWHLPTLISWNIVEESCGRPESKGVFMLPHEALQETWNIYTDMHEFHRNLRNSTVDHKSICRFKPKSWLNDELVNSYTALLPDDRPSIKVVSTFVFPKLQGPYLNQEGYFNRVVSLVFSRPPGPSSLIIL